MINNDFLKIGLIIVGAVILFNFLNRYQKNASEGYDSANADASAYGTGRVPPLTPVIRPDQMMPPTPVAPATQIQQPDAMGDYQGELVGAYADKPTACFPKDTLTADDLLPKDKYSKWAAVNPDGQGNLQDKNFLEAGYHVGIDTQGESLRNANMQLRSEPPNPMVKVSPWMQSTIGKDLYRRPLE